jgi:predicted alpha/beta superfamily hydrolase
MVMPAITLKAQYQLRLVVKNNSNLHREEPVFVAGNFNNWNPGNSAYKMNQEKDELNIHLPNLLPGIYEFKFTRGNWGKVACTKSGADVGNSVINLTSDTVLYYFIEAWKDDFAVVEKKHTASENVSIIDTGFYMPQLNRNRRISIYLPEGYKKSSKHYPVLYMHDGQNLFDEYTSGYGEWGVDECLDSLIKKGARPCIVVGIDNGPKRMNEYNPFTFEQFGEGEGDAYVNFLVKSLKPFIDKHYRTLPSKENTIIAGSSMGGLISYYALLKHPEVFGKAGVFSPAFWTAPQINNFTDSLAKKMNGLVFFYMGGYEGQRYLDDMMQVSDKLGSSSTAFIYTAIDSMGMHNEKAWHKWFADFYQWITADGFNYVIKVTD